jgi:hypothetical protein
MKQKAAAEWLTGRKQRVIIGEEKSDWEEVDSGGC